MSFGDIRRKTQQAAQPQESDTLHCRANGCTGRGTISLDGGRFFCSSHAFAEPDQWSRITEGLRDHDWLVAFTADIQRMNRTHQDWRSYAVRFWEGQDDYCKPAAEEVFIHYFNRMKGELDYRLGLCKRPAIRIVQPAPVRARFGNLASKVAA